jgi:hypothetical protein
LDPVSDDSLAHNQLRLWSYSNLEGSRILERCVAERVPFSKASLNVGRIPETTGEYEMRLQPISNAKTSVENGIDVRLVLVEIFVADE